MTDALAAPGAMSPDALARFLSHHPPFDALAPAELLTLASTATVRDVAPGATVLDAFAAPSDAMFAVLSGEVELWNTPEAAGLPDETLTVGEVFGYSAMLSGSAVGPVARAHGPVRLARIPADAVTPAFSSGSGIRFLAESLTSVNVRVGQATYGVVDELIVTAPLVVPPTATVAEVARAMTAREVRYAVVDLGEIATSAPCSGGSPTHGLVTDGTLRRLIVAEGRSGDTPVTVAMLHPAPRVFAGTLAAQALLELTDRDLHCLLVVERTGELRGIVDIADFLVSPSTVGVSLRQQIARSTSTEQLVVLARCAPQVLSDLLRRGRSAGEMTTVYSTVVDAIAQRALTLVLADHPEVDANRVTWLALGSNGRREPVFSSDVDAAVVLAPDIDPTTARTRYRPAFDAVGVLLDRCGLRIDRHGAVPWQPSFARTRTDWRAAADDWIDNPLDNNGLMMISLMLDARPIHGEPGPPMVADVFGDVHRHPGTLRLLLAESLSHRARLRSMRDVLARRGGTFDIKTHALRPVVDIARWAALAVGSGELSTSGRLAAAAGSPMVPGDSAQILIEVFEVLQKTRLRYQLAQIDRGEEPSDVLSMRRLSPLDRSMVGQSVREISAVQKRMSNLSQLTDPATW
ncbi:MAG: putative nucleotidyltransferase substrate binding domain-containing protein [Nakamurella sp.]